MQQTARKYYHAAAIVIFYIFHVIDKIIYVVNSDRIDANTLKMHIYIRFLMEMHKDEANTWVLFELNEIYRVSDWNHQETNFSPKQIKLHALL